MTPARHAAAKEIFLAVLELEPAARGRRLDALCGGDAELRREVESLCAVADDGEASGPKARVTPVFGGPGARAGSPPVDARTQPTPVSTSGDRGGGEPFEAGTLFAGRYRIVAELGRGGMGRVYRAHDLVLDQPVAVKLIAGGRSGVPRPGLAKRMIDEVRLARRVTHPNVCRVFDFGEAEGETFLTMEYVDGEDLRSLLQRIGRLPGEKLIDLGRQLASGLAAAHAQGILHRDLKPANVMIDGRGEVKITDFGLATTAAPGGDRAFFGTPAYLAPEQWTEGRVSVASDVYALGLVLHEMATGEPVFRGSTLADFAEQHTSAALPPVSSRLAQLEPRLEALILRCLEKDPRDRPPSAAAVAAALPGGDRLELAMLAGETPSPDAVAEAERPAARRTREALPAALLAVAVVGVLALADRAFPARGAWRGSPPEVLAARAAEVLRELGYGDPARDRAWGFQPDPVGADPDGLVFWYRQSPEWMLPTDFLLQDAAIRVAYYDPPPIEAGMVQMLLDPAGRLVTLKVQPGGFFGDVSEKAGAGEPGGEPDWAPLLAAVGLGEALAPAAPRVVPPFYADRRAAWQTTGAQGEPRLRLEAATFGARVVFADLRRDAGEEGDAEPPFSTLADWAYSVDALLWAAAIVTALVLARLNLRGGRSDLVGARRLAAAVAGFQLVRWLAGSDHFPVPEDELLRLGVGASRALAEGALGWVAYVALEPMVRRFWPHTLVGWTRLWRGRFPDPEVGRSLLVGASAGAGLALVAVVDRLLVRALGLVAAPEELVPWQLESGLAARRWLASTIETAVDAVYWAVLGLFLLAVLRRGLGRPRAALVGWVLLRGALGVVQGGHPAVSWLTVGFGAAAIGVWILVRAGLLAYVVALVVQGLLLYSPVTLDLGSWYGEAGLFALLLAVAVGAVGWWGALARPSPGVWTGDSSTARV